MLSMSSIPVSKATSVPEKENDTKDRILFSLQLAVKQIQSYSSLHIRENCVLTLDNGEVHQLCESLDKVLFHGLKVYHDGYWPFAKEFAHNNTVKYIESLQNAPTDIQRGRAWLCLALNESSLESYFRSFQANIPVVKRFYALTSLLRDEQRIQLILMLMAGLENIPVAFDIEKVNWGSGFSFFTSCIMNSRNRTPSSGSSDVSQYELVVLPSQPSSQDDEDSGVSEYDNANRPVTEHNIASKHIKQFKDIDVKNTQRNFSTQEIERITKYINMALVSEALPGTDLEVVRTKVVRRLKKSSHHGKNCSSPCLEKPVVSERSDIQCDLNRLSKVTIDSGFCVEDESGNSSGRDSPDSQQQTVQSRLSFDVGDIQRDLSVVFSAPQSQMVKNPLRVLAAVKVSSTVELTEERGAPEGQEDPVSMDHAPTNRLPLLPGSDGLDGDDDYSDDEEEVSIYDISKTASSPCVKRENSVSIQSNVTATSHDNLESSDLVPAEQERTVDPVMEELELLSQMEIDDRLDIRLDYNTLLYLTVEIFEYEEEKYYKMFHGYLNFPKGSDMGALLLLTNKSLYILKPGNNTQKFILCNSILYSNIWFISLSLNAQGFTIVSKNKKQELSIFTADEYLTGSILSNLEVALRRSLYKEPLPVVIVDATPQIRNLKAFLKSELKFSRKDVDIHNFSLARWEDYVGKPSPTFTPAGPKREGFLMYRHFSYDGYSTDESTLWCPAYFILNGGVLYCMEDDSKIEPIFFVELGADCKGCRRVYLPKRPYAFEVFLSKTDSLQLAASDDYEVSLWREAFLQTVSLAGRFIDSDGIGPVPCCIICCDEYIVAAKEVPGRAKILGLTNICDLLAVHTSTAIPNCILMEFAIAEASKSCGEWIVVFETEAECEKFIDVVRWKLSSALQVELEISSIKDLSLIKRLQLVTQNIASEKTRLRDLCCES